MTWICFKRIMWNPHPTLSFFQNTFKLLHALLKEQSQVCGSQEIARECILEHIIFQQEDLSSQWSLFWDFDLYYPSLIPSGT